MTEGSKSYPRQLTLFNLTIAVYLLLFASVGYTLAAKTWRPEPTQRTMSAATASMAATPTNPEASTSFEETSLPASFRGTTANELKYADALTPLFQRIARGESVRILQIGDSHIRGNYMPMATSRTLEQHLGTSGVLEGVDMDVAPELDGGIVFEWQAQNGAHASRYCEEDKLDEIAAFRPDLVIISFGTNEAHGSFDAATHIQTLHMLTQSITRRNPGVLFLLTTPPGSYIATYGRRWRDRRGRWHYNSSHDVNSRTAEVSAAISDFARDAGCALWDIYEIAGGRAFAASNWRSAGLMQNDCIHFTADAYTLQGKLLGEAIIKAYLKSGTL